MKTKTGYIATNMILASLIVLASITAWSCKSPLFGLGGVVDNAVPSITIAEVEEGGIARPLINGDYVRGAIILRGGVSDDIGIATVKVSFTDGEADISIDASIGANSTSWEASLQTLSYFDGDKDFTITVTDTAGKTSSTRFVLYFDNKPPTVLLTVPSADEGTATDALYGTIDIKGSAADQFGIRKVRVFLYGPDGTLLYSSPDDASIGTNSFALRLDTSSLIGKTGDELGYLYVRAWDRSGNTNTQFYRLDEIKALNANQGATVEELHALETGASSSANGITLTQAAGTRRYQPGTGYTDTNLVSYHFDQSSNLPIITISNPEEGKTATQNLLSTNAKAMGLVQDANGVAAVEVQFRLVSTTETAWYSDSHPGVAGDDIDVSGTGRVVNWTTQTLFGAYGGLIADVQHIRVRATDEDGNVRTSDWVPFTIDANVPDITISSPAPGDYMRGSPVDIAGTARSYGVANVGQVEVSISGLFDYTGATILSGAGTQEVAWSFGLTSAQVPVDGTYTVKARVTDSSNKQALYNIVLTLDRTAPHDLAFISPSRGSSVNGYPTIMGQAKDNILLKEVYLVFEKKGDETLLSDAYNWSYDLDAGAFANTDYGYDMGNNIYRVPFRIKAVDQAGNENLSTSFGNDEDNPAAGSYYLDIDLDGDNPEITNIVSPGAENTAAAPYVITGSIKVQGTANDDDRLHSVEMALVAISGATESWRSLAAGANYASVAENTFYPINGTSLWSQVLNDGGELYALPGFAGHAGDFKIIVRAVDTKDLVSSTPAPGITGDAKTIHVRFDNTLPGVINLLPEEGTMQSGTFPLTFTAQDNFSIVLAQVSYDNGSSYATLPITAGPSITFDADDIPVNTKTVNAGIFATSSGTLYMRIRLKDDGNNITEKSFKYLVDNIAPVDVTPPSTATMSNINNRMYTDAGASLAEILGTVRDTGTVRGIDRVEVYFERAGQIYMLNPDEAASTMAGRNHTFTNGVTALYPYATELDDSGDFKIIIDKAENYIDNDNDGYEESLTEGSTGHTWGARFDSSKISDGDVIVHYVAWDEAGNSAHFQVAGKVQNNPPVLATITLGTDLNADNDTVDGGERVRLTRQGDGSWRGFTLDSAGDQLGTERAYDLDDPVLTVRNSRFTFAATVSGGNPALSYRALAPDGSTALLDWSATGSYSVTAFGSAGWTEDAVNALTIQARDSAFGTPLTTENLTFRVRVDNADGTAPLISLAPVGDMYSEPSTGTSLAYASRLAGDLAAYSDNVHWVDSDSNGVCSWDERLGHVELPDDSLYDGTDADVSGIVKLRGKVYDDQRVSRMTVAFSVGFDTNGTSANGAVPSGTEIDLAQFSSGSLSAVAARAAAQDPGTNTLSFELTGKNEPELSDELGHAMNFTLTWNTAFITGVAAADVTVTVRAYNADGSLSETSTRTVDVVPYITGISTNASGVKDGNIRSSTGSYSIQAGNEINHINVRGFNLNVDSARVSGSAIAADAGGDTITISTAAVSPWTTIGLRNDSDRSGYLTLFSPVDIPTINNLNSNVTTYDGEPDVIRKNLTLDDNRYINFFSITDTGYTGATYPVMVMNEDVPTFGYAHNGAASGTGYYETLKRQGSRVARGWQYSQNALARDAAGNFYQVSITDNSSASAGGLHLFYNVYSTTANDMSAQWAYPEYSGYTSIRSYNAANNALALDHLKYDGDTAGSDAYLMLNRFKRPRITVKGDAASIARIYMAYYDSRTAQLAYRHFQIGASTTNVTTLTGAVLSNQAEGNFNSSATAVNRHNVTGSASPYLDIGVTDGNIVVLTYYDQANSQLRMIHSTAAVDASTPATQPTWSDPVVIDSLYSGTYVSMHIENDGNAGTPDPIHLAYHDTSDADLRYTYLASYDATPYSYKIDSFNSVGTLTEVRSHSGRPYIVYYNNSENGTRDSIKLAMYEGDMGSIAAGVDASGYVTGAWSSMTVPANDIPVGGVPDFNYIMLNFRTDGSPIIGYLADDIEWAVWLPEQPD